MIPPELPRAIRQYWDSISLTVMRLWSDTTAPLLLTEEKLLLVVPEEHGQVVPVVLLIGLQLDHHVAQLPLQIHLHPSTRLDRCDKRSASDTSPQKYKWKKWSQMIVNPQTPA